MLGIGCSFILLDGTGFEAQLLHDADNGFLGYLNALFFQSFQTFLLP